MHSTRLTGRVYFFVKCAVSGYFRLFDVSPVSDGFLLFLALLCVLEVDNLERCLGKGIDGQVSVDLRRHGNRLVTQKILCNIKRATGGLQVGRIVCRRQYGVRSLATTTFPGRLRRWPSVRPYRDQAPV